MRTRIMRCLFGGVLFLLIAALAPPSQALAAPTIVSLTFDDGSADQAVVPALLTSHGMHGTFYIISGFTGTEEYFLSWSQVHDIAAAGNEIGGHTLHHDDLTTLTPAQQQSEICGDRQNIIDHGFPPPVSFAYPYGASDPNVEQVVRACGYLSGRGVGLIGCPFNYCFTSESIPPADPYMVRTVDSLADTTTLAQMKSYVTNTEAAGGGWVILVFHIICQVAGCSDLGVSQANFVALLDWLQPRAASGTYVETVGQVMTGTLPTSPAVTLSPSSVSFTNQTVGTTSSGHSVTLTNSGSAALSIGSIAIGGTNSEDFAQTNTCPTMPATLPAGANCTISVTFSPTATGTRSATVQIADDASDSPQSVALSGAGTAPGPAVGLSPTSLAFGNQRVATPSGTQSTTLTNTGTAALSINSIAIGGANPTDFAQTNTCPSSGSTLPAGASCTISITFTPSAPGSRSASVQISDDAPDSPQSVALSGAGTKPAVTLSPTSLSFGSQLVGRTSAVQSVSLTNSGTAPLSISTIAIAGANPNDFAQTNTCPSGGSTLAAGAKCTISVSFTPSATGGRGANVNVVDDADGSPQSVSLSGAGSTSPIAFNKTLGQFAANTSASSIALTTGAATIPGSRVFVFVDWYGGSRTLSSLSGGGLSWTVDVQVKDSTGYHTAIASAGAPTGLPSSTIITATFSGRATAGLIAAASFTGIASSSPLDVKASNLQGGVAAWTGSVTTSNPNDLVLGWSGIDKSTTNTAASPNVKLFDFGNTALGERGTAEYRIETSIGKKTVNGTWASAAGATANSTVVAAYKAG